MFRSLLYLTILTLMTVAAGPAAAVERNSEHIWTRAAGDETPAAVDGSAIETTSEGLVHSRSNNPVMISADELRTTLPPVESEVNWSESVAVTSNKDTPASGEPGLAEVAQKSNNPVSDVWALVVQNDTILLGGDAAANRPRIYRLLQDRQAAGQVGRRGDFQEETDDLDSATDEEAD